MMMKDGVEFVSCVSACRMSCGHSKIKMAVWVVNSGAKVIYGQILAHINQTWSRPGLLSIQ